MKRAMLVVVLTFLAAAGGARAAENVAAIERALPDRIKASSQALDAARQQLLALAKAGQWQQSGVASPAEVSTLELRSPLPIYWVGLSDLREYKPDRDPASIVADGHEVLYLAIQPATERAASAVIVRDTSEGWKPVMFGFAKTAASIGTAQAFASKRGAEAMRFLLRIPALNISFLAFRSGNDLTLIAVTTNAYLGIHDGESGPAREFFVRIAQKARELNLEDASS